VVLKLMSHVWTVSKVDRDKSLIHLEIVGNGSVPSTFQKPKTCYCAFEGGFLMASALPLSCTDAQTI
jgi:hypothetical protein